MAAAEPCEGAAYTGIDGMLTQGPGRVLDTLDPGAPLSAWAVPHCPKLQHPERGSAPAHTPVRDERAPFRNQGKGKGAEADHGAHDRQNRGRGQPLRQMNGARSG